ncbi:histidinol-phosphate transaminase [Novosphingobium sp.]|uniref:pyridoxal phosphate-dependent aminotransferase n=1 Tax=Novosphingobium sp. TaxID=1874826 RepID=UPI0025D6E9D3|nr:histidinol-phosphate transaminase [Novosphingobium sp.]MCC6924629.1 histidinol-phosphate transaminase [Novosphingobium sp.]
MASKPTPKPWIAGIHAYVPGKSGGDGMPTVKLSANENPLGCSPQALDARASAVHPSRYPDGDSTALRAALGKLHGIDPARIIMGAGSGELLYLAASAYAGPGDEVLFSEFAFSLYDIVARRAGAVPVEAPARDYGTDVDALLAAVTERTRVVLVANPNNPTGTYLPKSEIARLHAGLPADVLLVIDLAYVEYVDPADDDGSMALAATAPNVLATRTFSKAYGLAGERVGWGTGSTELIEVLNRLRGAFNVSNEAQAMALAALEDQAFVEQSRGHNAAVRARFVEQVEALGNHGLRTVPSEANFVLVLFEGKLTGRAAYDGLASAGYMTRWFSVPGLDRGVRITIGTQDDMDAVARILRELAETA